MTTSESIDRPLSRQEVESFIYKYWNIFASKQVRAHEASFSPESFIFSSSSKRIEPGRLVLLRRQREYMNDATKLTVHVTNLQIEVPGPNIAVAAYNIQFDAEKRRVKAARVQKRGEKH